MRGQVRWSSSAKPAGWWGEGETGCVGLNGDNFSPSGRQFVIETCIWWLIRRPYAVSAVAPGEAKALGGAWQMIRRALPFNGETSRIRPKLPQQLRIYCPLMGCKSDETLPRVMESNATTVKRLHGWDVIFLSIQRYKSRNGNDLYAHAKCLIDPKYIYE